MFRKALSFGGLLLLAGAAVLVTPGSGQARPHGGGGGFHGGGFGGGFHGGGFHGGGFHRGFGGSPYLYPYAGYSNYYPYTYSSDWSSPAYDSGYYGTYGDATASSPGSGLSVAAQPDTRALVTVTAPADAEIWFQGTKTTSTGSVREYESPPLTPGSRYTYEVRVRLNENGHAVTQTQQVKVAAGAHVNIHFPEQPTKAPAASH